LSKTKSDELVLVPGSRQWEQIRHLATVPIPGKRSALYYLNEKILGHGPLCPMTPSAHYAMCLFAERATGIPQIDNARVQLIQVARGFGKSLLVTKGRAIQRLLAEDDFSLGIANETQRMADKFLGQIKLEFETNELLRALWPERLIDPRKTTWSASEIVIARKKPRATSPSVLAVGAGGTVTGTHTDQWIVDDMISREAAENALRGSFTEIEQMNRWLAQIEPLLCSPKRDLITIIGTPWYEGDTYAFCEEFWGHGEPKETFMWTLRLPTGEVQTLQLERIGELAIFRRPAREHGRSIFPERWTDEELDLLQIGDPAFFAANYLLEPTAGGASEFDPSWLGHYEFEGEQIRYRNQAGKIEYTTARELVNFVSVDPAISDSHNAARSAVACAGTNGTEIFLLEDFAERGLGMFDLAHRVTDSYIRYKPRYIFIETIAYQRAFKEALAQVARERGCPELMGAVQEIKSHAGKSKDFRIYGLEPYFKRRTFHVHRSHRNFLYEYSSFPRAKLRDVLDALSFQKDAWERMAANTGNQRQTLASRDAVAIERMRRSIGLGGGY
jgi:hypothetical protein